MKEKIYLEPCPCCGGRAKIVYDYFGYEVFIACTQCGMCTSNHNSLISASEVWNRRKENTQ